MSFYTNTRSRSRVRRFGALFDEILQGASAEQLDRREAQLRRADVLEVVDVRTVGQFVVPRIAFRVVDFDSRAICEAGHRLPGVDAHEEVRPRMAVERGPLSRRQVEVPDPDPLVFEEK